MGDLTEFLLARITDDETWARQTIAMEGELWPVRPEGWRWSLGPRGLAECKAKRRIIVESVAHAPTGRKTDTASPVGSLWIVLCALASVYADHPDFDAGWRV
ncbi:MAG TPA: DUF6221 family protein [Actinotalea sp.]|jgi:hypothetical protein